jgi:uncharacterized protein DUF2834
MTGRSVFALDVLVSALVVFVFAYNERRSLRLWWLPMVAVLAVGVSLGLPLLLYLRETEAQGTRAEPRPPSRTAEGLDRK